MSDEALEFIAPLLLDYYDFVSGNGGVHPDELLAQTRTASERALLAEKILAVNRLFAVTAPLRLARGPARPAPVLTRDRRWDSQADA